MIDPTTTSNEQRIHHLNPVAVPPEEQGDIAALHHLLEKEMTEYRGHLQLVTADGNRVPIPASIFGILEQVVQVMANGDAIRVVPMRPELTLQQAADLLNVPSHYLTQLLEEGDIPSVYSGTEYRIRIEDILAYKSVRDKERADSLDELTKLSQQYGGYNELESA